MSLPPAVLISLPNGLFQLSLSLIVTARKKSCQYCFSLLSIVGILALLGERLLREVLIPMVLSSLSSLVPVPSGFYFCHTLASLFMHHFILKMLAAI